MVQLPHQSLPSFLGYVEDEFIVVFGPEARRNVTVTQGQGGKPQVNLPSINALTTQYGVQRFQRQFPQAKPQAATSQFVDLTGHYKVLLKPGRNLNQALHAFEANPHVDHVEKIGVHTLSLTPNDPYYEDSSMPVSRMINGTIGPLTGFYNEWESDFGFTFSVLAKAI